MIDLSTLSDAQIYNLWESGIPKSRAYYSFVQAKFRTRYLRLKRLVSGRTSKNLKEMFDAASKGTYKPTLPKPSQYQNELDELKATLQKNARIAVQKGVLVPFGFEAPRHVEDTPVLIPKDIWSRSLYWNDDNFRVGDLKIVEVRFVHKNTITKHIENAGDEEIQRIHELGMLSVQSSVSQTVPHIKKRKANTQGRPSKRDVILSAYEYLDQTGLIDFTKPQKDAIYQIQSYIQDFQPDHYENGRGFGSETIRGYIAEDFSFKAL